MAPSETQIVLTYVRKRLNEKLEKQALRALARETKISHPALMAISKGDTSTIDADVLERFARAFGFASVRDLYDAAHEMHRPNSHRFGMRPISGNIPGWEQAEKEARSDPRGAHIPEWAWRQARTVMGAKAPREVNAQTVRAAALFVLEHGSPD